MTTARPTHVIIGASLAGAKAAETLRAEGFDGEVVLVGAEERPPYERPPLSKGTLRGESPLDDAAVHPEGFYEEHDITLRLGVVATGLDTSSRTVRLADGGTLRYDQLLLATGARPRRLPVPDADLPGIHHLRDAEDCLALRAALGPGARVAVVGAGWIGTEVAASARQMGAHVALIDSSPVPLAGVLGVEVGAMFRDLHAEHGVELHLGEKVTGLTGDRRVTGVVTDAGTIPADVVVVGVGVEPRVELAADAGLRIEGGIAVDHRLRTSAQHVFAAGDVAAAWHPILRRRIRVEHWSNAQHQGIAAAKNMLGVPTAFDRLPYFFTDQYDLGMEYSGYAPSWDRVVVRGDLASRAVIAFWLEAGCVVAAMNVNTWDVTDQLRTLLGAGRPVDESRLRDPSVALDDVFLDERVEARR